MLDTWCEKNGHPFVRAAEEEERGYGGIDHMVSHLVM